MSLILVVDRGASEGSPRSSSDKELRGPRSVVGWVLTVLDSRGWVIDLSELVGLIAAETTPKLGSIGRSAPGSMVANSTGFGYDSFEDACLDAMVAAEHELEGGCDAFG